MIVYFSGPHGAGKSSLIKAVCSYSDDFILYPDRLKFAHVEWPPLLRHKSKIAKLFQEYCDQLQFQKENPGKTVIGDRCVYDSFAYGRAYVSLGYISPKENLIEEEITRKWFDEFPDYVVLLNPPFETILERLQKRWVKKEKKWHEDNLTYLKAAYDAFTEMPSYFTGKSILEINQDISLEEEVDMVMNWARGLKLVRTEEKQIPLEALVYA